MSEVKENQSQFAIVRQIQKLLKLGEGGKLDSFFSRIKKTLERDIKNLNNNITTLRSEYEINLDKLNDKLQDAEEAASKSFLDIDINSIDTNARQDAYMDIYLQQIGAKADSVDFVKENIKSLKASHTDEVEAIELRITKIKEKLTQIVG